MAVVMAAAAAGACFVAVAVSRWDNFETSAFDLAFFDQIVYNTGHLRPGQTTFIPYNFNGQHFEPILLVFVGPYRLGAGPLLLMATQAVVAGAASIPLYLAGRRLGIGSLAAAAVAAAYLLNPYLHRGLNFDFHPEMMVALPAFAALWAMAAGHPRLAAALAASTLLFKEDAVFVALALALLWGSGAKKEAKWLAWSSVAWVAIVVGVVMPAFRHGAPSDLVERYGYLAGTHSQAAFVPGLLLHLPAVVRELFAPARLWTAALFLGVTAPLALARPKLLMLLVPGLMLALLADHDAQRELDLHYSANLLPVAFACGLAGAAALASRVPRPLLAASILLPTVAGFFALSPFAPGADSNRPPSEAHRQAVLEALALVPGDDQVSVAAQSGLLARVSQHDHVYEFPPKKTLADWVVVDRYGHRSSQSQAAGYDEKLAAVRATYEQVFDRDGVEVFRRRP